MVKQVQLNGGAVSVSYDPQKWGAPETDKEGIVTLDHTAGAGTGVIISERLGIPAERAIDDILEEFRKKYPDTQVVLRENRTVNGQEVGCLKISFVAKEVPLILYLYCYGGLAGTVQVRTCAAAPSFDECEPNFTEFLNGLEIRRPKHARLARMGQSLGFAGRLCIVALPVLGIAFLRLEIRTHWQMALTVTALIGVGIFLVGWIYDLVKFRLK